jgi:superfamily I DNA/RNA helicase
MSKTKVAKKFSLTPEQEAIKASVSRGENLVVNAKAGVGKSTTIRDVAPPGSVILCFNKAPADEMQESLNPLKNQIASTFHSYGKSKFPGNGPMIDKSKMHWLSLDHLFAGNKPTNAADWTRLASIKGAASWAKGQAFHPNDSISSLLKILQDERLDIENSPEEICDDVYKVLLASAEQTKSKLGKFYWKCDFDDMQWLPFVHGWGSKSVQDLFVDEAQDLSPIRSRLAQMWGNRIVAVGDEFQAIYAFTGSMQDSLSLFQKAIGAQELPLSICWRCPSSHLDLAREIVPTIQNRPKCPVGTLNRPETIEEVDVSTGALIICRTNAPLIRKYYTLRKENNNQVVIHSDIAGTLKSWIGTEYEGKNLLDAKWEAKYQMKLERKLKYAKTESSRMVIQDHDSAIQCILSNNSFKTVGEAHSSIENEFKKPDTISQDAIILSSGHGSKGLEHRNVVFYGTSLVPHPMAKLDWERAVECRLKYVMLTRSLDTLSLIPEVM